MKIVLKEYKGCMSWCLFRKKNFLRNFCFFYLGVLFFKNFLFIVKIILKRLFCVYVYIYY